MADDELEVLVEEDPPEVVDGAVVEPAAAETKVPETKPVTSPEEGVDVLKKQLETSRAEAAANAARAQAAERGAVQAKTETQQTQVQLVEGAIAKTKQDIEVLESQLADAYAAGDFTAAAKAQSQMARKAAEQLTLENGLENLKNAPKPQPPAPNDPVEAFASNLTPPAAAWIRAHPQYVTDPRLNTKLVNAHNFVESEGVVIDSPAYFNRMESLLGVAAHPAPQPAIETDALSEAAVAAGARTTSTAPPAAPARNGGNGTQRTIRLTREQVEAAEISGMTPQEYAKQLARIERAKTETIN
jgi:hypothetical protein